MKVGDLVHFVDWKETRYGTLGMIIGLYSMKRFELETCSIRRHGMFKVVWYDDDCGVEDYNEEDLELVSEGWKFSQ